VTESTLYFWKENGANISHSLVVYNDTIITTSHSKLLKTSRVTVGDT